MRSYRETRKEHVFCFRLLKCVILKDRGYRPVDSFTLVLDSEDANYTRCLVVFIALQQNMLVVLYVNFFMERRQRIKYNNGRYYGCRATLL